MEQDRFHAEFYLTALRDEKDYRAANITLRFGRPNIPKIFERVKNMCVAKSVKKVGVIVCGPISMVSDVSDCCKRFSGDVDSDGTASAATVSFDLHLEEFDF